MGESLTMRRCVEDEGLRVVNSCHEGTGEKTQHVFELSVLQEEATANSVPAAAVIQRSRAVFGFTGRKGHVGGVACRV